MRTTNRYPGFRDGPLWQLWRELARVSDADGLRPEGHRTLLDVYAWRIMDLGRAMCARFGHVGDDRAPLCLRCGTNEPERDYAPYPTRCLEPEELPEEVARASIERMVLAHLLDAHDYVACSTCDPFWTSYTYG